MVHGIFIYHIFYEWSCVTTEAEWDPIEVVRQVSKQYSPTSIVYDSMKYQSGQRKCGESICKILEGYRKG